MVDNGKCNPVSFCGGQITQFCIKQSEWPFYMPEIRTGNNGVFATRFRNTWGQFMAPVIVTGPAFRNYDTHKYKCLNFKSN